MVVHVDRRQAVSRAFVLSLKIKKIDNWKERWLTFSLCQWFVINLNFWPSAFIQRAGLNTQYQIIYAHLYNITVWWSLGSWFIIVLESIFCLLTVWVALLFLLVLSLPWLLPGPLIRSWTHLKKWFFRNV